MKYIKFIRVFLMVLILIGIGLLVTQRIWVPKIVNMILKNDNEKQQISTTSNTQNKPIITSDKNIAISAPLRVGAVTWHTKNFVNKEVRIVGFVLKKEKGYVLFSDEATGAITVGDLPVMGNGVDTMVLKQKYILQGKFLYRGLIASNDNLYHLELSQLPMTTK